ncbi:MAG TPA: hypothetical protein VEA44_04770, partial [Caulobacter sp.]|nr:hypothetical protein [Caulobacter sp.]
MPGLPTTVNLASFTGLGVTATGRDTFEFAGGALAAGDLNGDGLTDWIVGARSFDGDAGAGSGAVYVVFGDEDGLPTNITLADLDGTDGFRIEGTNGTNYLGYAVAAGRDINGDGIDDLVVGAPGLDDTGAEAGGVYVIYGKQTSFGAVVDVGDLTAADGANIDGVVAGDRLGRNIALGDVNGDGFADILIGSLFSDGYAAEAGNAWVVFGVDGGLPLDVDLNTLDGTNGFRLDGGNTGDRFGGSVAIGDINGDGLEDIIVGASAQSGSFSYGGAAYVIFGSEDPFSAVLNMQLLNGTNGYRIDAESADDRLGSSVAYGGDVNGDGIGDIVLGAPGVGGFYTGAAYVLFGGASPGASFSLAGLDGDNGFRVDGTSLYDTVGMTVGGAGDVNGDGFDDIVLGSLRARPGGVNYAGTAWVVFGRDSFDAALGVDNLTAGVGMTIIGGGSGWNAGESVAGADLDGDGVSDLLIGAPGHNSSTGRAFILYGRIDAATGAGGGTLDGGNHDDQLTGAGGVDTLNGNGGDDVIDGGAGDDGLYAGAGTDDLVGGLGHDILDGGAGADDMAGGIGDDTYFVDDAGDVTAEAGGEGSDVVRATITIAPLAANIETLILEGTGDIDGAGNAANNNLNGNAGANSLFGGDGNDLIKGGAGDDVLSGDAGADQLLGGTGEDELDGLDQNDRLEGGDGNDTILGGSGADILDGGADSDTLTGGAGADQLLGGAGTDTLGAGSENDILNGGAGADAMTGGTGDDVFFVDDAGDTTLEALNEGTDTVRASLTWSLAANVERLILDGTGDLDGAGNGLANVLTGNSGANRLDGGAGVDTVRGGLGNDTIIGGTGADVLQGGDGLDTFVVRQESVYSSAAPAGRVLEADTLSDLVAAQGDRIDLSAIDAIAGGADDAFTLVAAFTHTAGQMTLRLSGGNTILSLDVDGDGAADYRMNIAG